jgi:hypothetical protein
MEERIDADTVNPPVSFGALQLTAAEAEELSDASIVERLVETGFSRLTAARIVEVERGAGELGRARPHKMARR